MPRGTTPLNRPARRGPAVRRLLLAAPGRAVIDRARVVVADPSLAIVRREQSLLEVRVQGTDVLDVGAIVGRLRRTLSPSDAAVTRVVADDGIGGVSLLTAMTAPTLADLRDPAATAEEQRWLAAARTRCRAEYQPLVDLRADEAVVGYEALLRLDGDTGPVPVGALFAAAAVAGAAVDLDRAARTAALRGAGRWLGSGRLFVNVSADAVDDAVGMAETFGRSAPAAGLDPGQVVVELTESGRVRDVGRLVEIAVALRERGFLVALDDVGSGWSTVEAVIRVRPDVLKIDGGIVRAVPDPLAVAAIGALVAVAHSYGGEVVAEGVETEAQRDAVRDLGVDIGQGHLFGAAAPAGVHARRLARSGSVAPGLRRVAAAG